MNDVDFWGTPSPELIAQLKAEAKADCHWDFACGEMVSGYKSALALGISAQDIVDFPVLKSLEESCSAEIQPVCTDCGSPHYSTMDSLCFECRGAKSGNAPPEQFSGWDNEEE
jgi:hypothetical protein